MPRWGVWAAVGRKKKNMDTFVCVCVGGIISNIVGVVGVSVPAGFGRVALFIYFFQTELKAFFV